MKYNNSFTNDFGLKAFIFSQACQSDYTIMCVPYNSKDIKSIKYFNTLFKYRFDFKIDYLCVSNIKLIYDSINECYVYNYIKNSNEAFTKIEIPKSNMLNENIESDIFNNIINSLK